MGEIQASPPPTTYVMHQVMQFVSKLDDSQELTVLLDNTF